VDGYGEPSAVGVVRLLAEPARLRVFAAVVLGATSLGEVTAATGLDVRDVAGALRRLADGGLVEMSGDRVAAVDGVFAELARSTAVAEPVEDLGYTDERVATVLRTFVRNGRLLGMPAQRRRRIAVLEHIAQSFEPGIEYPESEVNGALLAWCEGSGVDHVSVRRYLVDEGLLRRADGRYARSGGWTDVSA
jgi:hypothetical protein